MFVNLPVDNRPAIERLHAISAQTADLKERRQAVGAEMLLGMTEYVAPTLMNLAAVSSAKLVDSAFHVATTHGRAIYDCLYVALTEQIGAVMVSADEKLVNALGGRYAIRWLGAL